ncbi:tetratricopeptide repeat protein [Polyangium sp. 15x6]|uniref:tetratricopeptide repeat protein n=1 Tax=Polyangium sp. 15x6 TaxID=3042687 RepID=UPI00249B29DA|nr:tetratricopeptide repeat protein [Polyangium sp. 15x6]MDI3288822.1 tetratricopeptide repeat protein [Polyangium sp. 15x6]
MSTAVAAPRPWLFGPWPDLLLGCGIGYGLVVVALAAIGAPMGSLEGWLPLVVLVTGIPHYGATLLRVYGTESARRRYFLYAFPLGFLVWGAFAASFAAPRLGTWLITLYLTWSPWHYTAQNFGLVMMFLRRAGITPSPALRRLVWISFVLSFVLVFANIHGSASAGGADPLQAASASYRFAPLGIPTGFALGALSVAGASYVVVTGLVIRKLGKLAAISRLVPALSLVASQAAWFVLPVLLGLLRPALYGPKGATALAFIWVAIAHSVQYLWISFHYARASGSVAKAAPAGLAYLGKTVLAGSAIWVLPAIVCAPGALGILPFESGLGLLVAAAVNVHHFILDGAIWKLRDGAVGNVLVGQTSAAPQAAPAVRGFGAWVLRAAFVAVGLVAAGAWAASAWEKEMGIRRAAAAGDLARVEAAAQRLALLGRDGPRIHVAIGRLYEARGEKDAAHAAYEAALALDPEDATALDRIAESWIKRGDFQRALDARYRAARNAPDRPAFRRRYEELLARLQAPPEAGDTEVIVVGGAAPASEADAATQTSRTTP